MKFSTSSLALALGVVAAPAFAGGLAAPIETAAPAAPVVVAPAPAADGNWNGFYAGAQLGYGESDASDDSFNDEGAVYGGQVGYNYDFGRFVVGAELDAIGTELSSTDGSNDLDAVVRAKLRAGYDAGAFLPYVTAGYASAFTSEEIAGDDQFDGYVYGAGLDYKATDNIVVGAEVLQHEFEDLSTTSVDLDATTVAARVSYQF